MGPALSPTQSLTALVSLISNAVKVVIDEYEQHGHPEPSLNSTSPGPFDALENTSPDLARAVRTIEAACAQLSFTVANPGHVMVNKAYSHFEPTALLVALDGKIAEILEDKPEGLHIADIAKASGLDQDKLGRILRMLATRHCFREVRSDVFANNRLSVKLLSRDPVSGLIGLETDEAHKGAVFLSEAMLDPSTGPSSCSSINNSAFTRAHGRSFFDYYATPEGKERYKARLFSCTITTGCSRPW
jgi:hypothetical protein